jgi:hypothetical protein
MSTFAEYFPVAKASGRQESRSNGGTVKATVELLFQSGFALSKFQEWLGNSVHIDLRVSFKASQGAGKG